MIKTKIYNIPIHFYINPIFPDRRILYYNHDYYDIDNNPTPTTMYYHIKDIQTGDNLIKHYKLEDEYNVEDLKYIVEKLGIKSCKLNKIIRGVK